jgi:hypothetical protein
MAAEKSFYFKQIPRIPETALQIQDNQGDRGGH